MTPDFGDFSDSTHKTADTENGRKIWLSHQMPLPQSLLQVMGEVTEWGPDGWSVQVEPRRIQSQSVHGFNIVFASNAGEREIRMQPVHLLDGRGGTPGTFVGYDVVDTGYSEGRGGDLANPIAKGVAHARALATVLAQAPSTGEPLPRAVERDNQRRQRLDPGAPDPHSPDQLTTRGGGRR